MVAQPAAALAGRDADDVTCARRGHRAVNRVEAAATAARLDADYGRWLLSAGHRLAQSYKKRDGQSDG
ncbi:MAG TPA: hypothetical protein VK879_01825 [Candidatus Sulfomarinibacteraceae bacterium]|nr:hypothetical protein [Candidatus Sulfomarinibacteraceae bacterium]